MKVTDITGEIKNGMWNYEEPFPRVSIKPLGQVPWAGCKVFCEVFEGLHSQTGTYIETPAHYFGNDKCYLAADIPVEKLLNIRCTILKPNKADFTIREDSFPITEEMLAECPGSDSICEGSAILVGTGWGSRWMDPSFLEHSPYFTRGAMNWLISKKPFLLGTDFPRWENLKKPEGFFKDFYNADILMLAPCVNLEKIMGINALLTVLPLKIPGTSCVPCRAVIMEEDDECD